MVTDATKYEPPRSPAPTPINVYLGDVRQYTIPASMLIGGGKYEVTLFATPPLGVERMYPHWLEVRPAGTFEQSKIVLNIEHDHIRPVEIISPLRGSEVPLGDVTVKWKFSWSDVNRIKPVMILSVEDETTKTHALYDQYFQVNDSGTYSYTIPKAAVVSGHLYSIQIAVRYDGQDIYQLTTFRVK